MGNQGGAGAVRGAHHYSPIRLSDHQYSAAVTSNSSSGEAPILDFDSAPTAIIEPSEIFPPLSDLPKICVITWMGDAHDRFVQEHAVTERSRFVLETVDTPIHQVTIDGTDIVVARALVGAPVSVGLLEHLCARGCDTFLAIGSSGGLVPDHPPGSVVIIDKAIRDEGTSYHYAAAERTVDTDPQLRAALRTAFTNAGFAPVHGTVWTTDAIFRETSDKVARRVAEGAIAVDMEASAMATVAAFRGARIGHAVYYADTLHGDVWDGTELLERDTSFRYRLLMTVVEAAVTLGRT